MIVEKEEEISKLLKRGMGKKRTGNEVTDETKTLLTFVFICHFPVPTCFLPFRRFAFW